MQLESRLSEYKNKEIPIQTISKELFAQYTEIKSISLTRGSSINAESAEPEEQIVAIVSSERPIDGELHDRLESWLKVRLGNENVIVVSQMQD